MVDGQEIPNPENGKLLIWLLISQVGHLVGPGVQKGWLWDNDMGRVLKLKQRGILFKQNGSWPLPWHVAINPEVITKSLFWLHVIEHCIPPDELLEDEELDDELLEEDELEDIPPEDDELLEDEELEDMPPEDDELLEDDVVVDVPLVMHVLANSVSFTPAMFSWSGTIGNVEQSLLVWFVAKA